MNHASPDTSTGTHSQAGPLYMSYCLRLCCPLLDLHFPPLDPLSCNVSGARERSLHRFLVPITKIFETLTPVRFANYSKPVVLQYSPKFLLHIHRRERLPSLFRSLIRAVQGCQRHVEDTVCLVGSVSHLKSPRLWTIPRIEKEWHVALDTNCWSHRCVTEFVSLLARTWADLEN